MPMFEVNVFDPAQTGALFSFLAVRRGPLSYVLAVVSNRHSLMSCRSVLIHPNTGDALGDHTVRATWMGQPYPLILKFLGAVSAAPRSS